MSKIKIVTFANYVPPKGEKLEGKSLTMPNQSMSIPELIKRFTQGKDIEGFREPVFDENNEYPDLRFMDLSEQQDALQEARKRVEATQKELSRRSQKKQSDQKKQPEPSADISAAEGKDKGQGAGKDPSGTL